MLHLHFGLNFEALAFDLMDKLKASWVNPFKPPVIIFPDLALEHWFKLKWMDKYGVLANLNTKFLDAFLFESLNETKSERFSNEPAPEIARLSGEMLQNIILAWLQKSDNNGNENWRTLDKSSANEVANYLQSDETQDASADESRLFDFASMIARLFMEYETTRPGTFIAKDGLIQAWSNPEITSFFKNSRPDREEWQKTLYQRLFTDKDALIHDISQTLARRNLHVQYMTLPQRFESARNQRESDVFKDARETPIFIFWHAGIGQFYRVALHEYAKYHDVYAYIQNPCMDFWEDIQNGKPVFRHPRIQSDPHRFDLDAEIDDIHTDNQLLAKWGRAGRDNIKLWCESVNYDFTTFEDQVLTKAASDYTFYSKSIEDEPELTQDTLLHQIQYSIAHRIHPNAKEVMKSDLSLTIHCAPSKIREIEDLHSQICLLLNAGAQIQDMLIVAPNINNYRTAIHQVFASERSMAETNRLQKRQHKEVTQTALYIPFTILDGEPRESLTAHALKTLFQIGLRGTLTRIDFFELVRNPVVQQVRGIHPEEINAWESWLVGMNVFRDREIFEANQCFQYEDWKTGIKRLLLARLTDSRVQDGNDILMPYADLETANNTSLCHFVDAVESLEDFCKSCKNHLCHGITEKMIDENLIPFFNSWIALDQVPREMAFENVIYQNVINAIEQMKFQYDAGIERITLKCFELSILNAAQDSHYMVGSPFVNGLTFMDFTANRVIPIKHLFFLGLDAASFPGRDSQNSLDLRTNNPWPGDNQNAAKNRYAFLGQFMSTSESMHLSYINKNLQKDQDFFPSSVIYDLLSFIAQAEQTNRSPIEVPLDETRPIETLFTSRALRNRALYQRMITSTEHPKDRDKYLRDVNRNPRFGAVDNQAVLPERMTLNQIKKFLNDPFQFRISELLQRDMDEIDPQRIIYEPIDVDWIELIEMIKVVAQLIIRQAPNYANMPIQKILPDGTMTQEKTALTPEAIEQTIQWVIERFMQDLRESGFRTSDVYNDLLENKIRVGAENVAKQMIEGKLIDADDDNDINIFIQQDLGCHGSKTWNLIGTADWHVWNKATQTLSITSVSLGKYNDSCYKYLNAYISALALIVQNTHKSTQHCDNVKVDLFVCCTDDIRMLHKAFMISADEAENILKEAFHASYIEQFSKAAPLKILEDTQDKDGNLKQQIPNFEKLCDKLNDKYGPWGYFKKAKLFDLRTDIGYDAYHHETFVKQWNDTKTHQNKLLYPLKPIFAELRLDDQYSNTTKSTK